MCFDKLESELKSKQLFLGPPDSSGARHIYSQPDKKDSTYIRVFDKGGELLVRRTQINPNEIDIINLSKIEQFASDHLIAFKKYQKTSDIHAYTLWFEFTTSCEQGFEPTIALIIQLARREQK